MDLTGTRVAVLGGDKRELEIIRQFIGAGADVITFGGIVGGPYEDLRARSLGAALSLVDIIACPMPGLGNDGSLFAPHSASPIWVDEDGLAPVNEGAICFVGRSDERMRSAAARSHVTIHDFVDSDWVQVQHAIPTAEAAIALAVRETEETVHGARCLIIGYGRIGQVLAAYLRGWGAAVTVAARRAEVRARAEAYGHRSIGTTTAELASAIQEHDLVFTTAPAQLVNREVLADGRAGQFVVDLASPPGGMDHAAAKDLSVRFVWARAQADSAWRHSGRAQFQHMMGVLGSDGWRPRR